MRNRRLRAALGWSAGAVAAAAAAYAGYVVTTWVRYGQPARPDGDAQDPLLDRFMPVYDIAERHHIRVAGAHHDRSGARDGSESVPRFTRHLPHS